MRWLISLAIGLSFITAQAASVSWVGIGIVLEQNKKNQFQITDFVEGSSAKSAGAQRGEIISAIEGQSTEKLKLEEVTKRIGGTEGSFVTLSLASPDQPTTSHDLHIQRIKYEVQCVLEGNVNLFYSGSGIDGTLYGNIGSDHVNFFVNGGRIYTNLKGFSVNLTFTNDPGMGQIAVEGWIGSNYVRWNGSGNNIYGYQSCIF